MDGLGLDGGAAKRPRLSAPQEGDMCCKLLVSPNAAGKIIGRGGEEIKALREQLGVGLHIQGPENVFPKSPAQQIAVVFGSRENIDAAFEILVAKILEGEPHNVGGDGKQTRVTTLCSHNAASAIIGTKGATVKELRTQSGCNISVDTDIFMGEQLAHVTGHSDKIHNALALLTPLIEKSADSLQFAEAKYGGGGCKGKGDDWGSGGGCKGGDWGGMDKGKGMGKGKGFGKDMGYNNMQMGGGGMGMQQQQHQQQMMRQQQQQQQQQQMMMQQQQQQQQQMMSADALAVEEERMVMESQSAITFSIPKDAIGRVLGKGGSNSAEIRRHTGAHLKIEPREEDGLVTLSGQLHQTHKAHCMVVGRVLSSF